MNVKQILIILIDTYNVYRKRPIYTYKGVTHINWWEAPVNKTWFADNLYERFGDKCKDVRIYSIFGRRSKLRDKVKGVKIFFSGENLVPFEEHKRLGGRIEKVVPFCSRIKSYGTNINKYKMDIVLTSCTDGLDNAIRFPYWMLVHFGGCYSQEDVRNRLNDIEEKWHDFDSSRKGAAMVASHDFWGTRTDICDAVKNVIDITYGGKWRNSTDDLWNKYSNNKSEFLRKFRFNICPENMDAKDYVTEKIWDSFEAGCIPVYNGALSNPEPQIFNRDTFVLWSYDEDNARNLDMIKRLNSDDHYYREWKHRKLFKEGADEYIYSLLGAFYRGVERFL